MEGISIEGQKRWMIDDPRDNLPEDGHFVIIQDHPTRKNLLSYPGTSGAYNREEALEHLPKFFKHEPQVGDAWIELID